MKKILLSLITGFLIILPCNAEHAWVKITWKDGKVSKYTAKEYWTNFYRHDGYWAFNQNEQDQNTKKEGWICFADYSGLFTNDYVNDYVAFYDFMKEEGNLIPEEDVHFEKHETEGKIQYKWYCVSFRKDAFDKIEVQEK